MPAVKEIYRLCASGLDLTYIYYSYPKRKILKPSMHNYEKTGKYCDVTGVADPYGWNGRTVADILDTRFILGIK